MKIRNGFVSNSSSSSFVCDTKMSLNEVTEKVHLIYNFYKDLFKITESFEDMFEEPRYATTKDIEYPKNWDKDQKITNGSILINSSNDNSIPYELFELIEEAFNANRMHLG